MRQVWPKTQTKLRWTLDIGLSLANRFTYVYLHINPKKLAKKYFEIFKTYLQDVFDH